MRLTLSPRYRGAKRRKTPDFEPAVELTPGCGALTARRRSPRGERVSGMRVLFIGGSGVISSACSWLAVERDIGLVVLNRGSTLLRPLPEQATVLRADPDWAPASWATCRTR